MFAVEPEEGCELPDIDDLAARIRRRRNHLKHASDLRPDQRDEGTFIPLHYVTFGVAHPRVSAEITESLQKPAPTP